MRTYLTLGLLAAFVVCTAISAPAVTPTKSEIDQMHRWVQEAFQPVRHAPTSATLCPPFSFTYDGKPGVDTLVSCKFDEATKKLDANRTQTVQTYKHEATGLEVRCVIVEYSDYPAVEWTLWFKNTGEKNTPIIEKVLSIDQKLERGESGEFVLNGILGDRTSPESYQPYKTTLEPKTTQTFAPWSGYGTCKDYPFYNLEMPGGGLIIVIGWPGQWSSSFVRDEKGGLHITAGQQMLHTYLKPGEEIRSPLMALVFWQGNDRLRAQNIWRGWMMDHNMPRTADGKLTPTQFIACNQGQVGFVQVSEQNVKEYVDLFLKRGIPLDGWNIDAGWFECPGDWWLSGTWEADPKRFPNGVKAVSDYLHSKGIRFINWFEPERVGSMDSWLGKNHPEWLTAGDWDSWLLDLGNPDARKWVLEHIDKKIGEHGIDFYRQDFNIPPLRSWTTRDGSPDRQGITENLHNQGYLWWWDELRKRRPNLLMDCCASGGRRNDLETLRRAVPLHRTDYVGEPMSQQCHHYGLSQWVPYHGAGYSIGNVVIPPPDCPPVPPPDKVDVYYFRSAMSPTFGVSVEPKRDDYDYALLNRLIAEWKQISKYYIGDFYPLTEHSTNREIWMAWQYHRDDLGEGVVQAFRRENNKEPITTLLLHGLDPAARYRLADLDTNAVTESSGKDLMEKGLVVEIATTPGARIVTYTRVSGDR